MDRELLTMQNTENGAVASFIGTVREDDDLLALQYESYGEMAAGLLMKLCESAVKKFEVNDITVVHRVGTLAPGDRVVLVAVGAPHREEAFRACEWLVEGLKKKVPIWKKELRENEGGWL